MTYKDTLTGVGNKAAFERLSEELAQQMQTDHREPFGIVMMDVNNPNPGFPE